MSLEEDLKSNTAAVKELTAALKAGGAVAAVETGKKGAGRPAGSTNKDKAVSAPAADTGDDGLGLGDDDGLGDLGGEQEELPAFTFEDLKKLMIELRDVGGAGANKADCQKVMAKFKVSNFKELDGQDERYNEIADYIKKAIAAKKKG